MKGLAPLFLGIFGTFAFSWIGLTVIPTWQIGHLNPESDEEGTDIYPRPQSGMFERGEHVYAANGCVYCHSQQVRADYIADDIERKWGNRRSAPRDYIFERPVFLGKMRMGQDLANIGARAPAPEGGLRLLQPKEPAVSSHRRSPGEGGSAVFTSSFTFARDFGGRAGDRPLLGCRSRRFLGRGCPRSGGLQPARRSPGEGGSAVFTSSFTFARDFACQRGFAKCITAAWSADRRRFAITRTNGEHYLAD